MQNEKLKTYLSLISILILIAIIAFGLLGLDSANTYSFQNSFDTPSFNHIFGTDNYGRDMAQLTLSGLSISLLAAFLSSMLSVIVAVIVAIFTSSNNKFLSSTFETLTNAILGIPHIVLMILISFAFGKGAIGVIAAVSFTHWATLSRILSNELMQIKTSNWYKIESGINKNKLQLVTKHIIPNLSPQIATGFNLAIPHCILHESTLTFLGFGFSPEIPAIGNILSYTLKYVLTGNWWLAILPGVSLILVIIIILKLTDFLKLRKEMTI